MQRRPENNACVVGAGPAGLAMARTLKRLHVEFDVYERHSEVGGIWDQANPGSPIYDRAHFISSKTKSHFLDFEMPEHYPDYPSHRQILAYLRACLRPAAKHSSQHRRSKGRQTEAGWAVTSVRIDGQEIPHAQTDAAAPGSAAWSRNEGAGEVSIFMTASPVRTFVVEFAALRSSQPGP